MEYVFSARVYNYPNSTDLSGFGADELMQSVMGSVSEYLRDNYRESSRSDASIDGFEKGGTGRCGLSMILISGVLFLINISYQ